MIALFLGSAVPMLSSAQGPVTYTLHGEVDGSTVIVHGTTEDPDRPEPMFRAIWRIVSRAEAGFEMQRTAAPAEDGELALNDLLTTALGVYLDAHVKFRKQGVEADLPPQVMIDEMAAMTRAAVARYADADAFHSFSAATTAQLDRLTRIDWSQASFGIDGGNDQDKYLAIYFFVRTQRDELERQIKADLSTLSGVLAIGPEKGWAGTRERIASTCGTVFDDDNFLCALDLAVSDSMMSDPQLSRSMLEALNARVLAEAGSKDADVQTPMKVRKRDRWLKVELDQINERIDRIDQRKELWAVRDRLDDIEGRLTDLQLQVDDIREDKKDSDNPLANLSFLTGNNIKIRFARNSAALDAEYRVVLNEVFEQLARNPREGVLITGFTDRSGDPLVNLALSEQRAKAVRNYLMERGIAPERLMVNYYGDSRSMGRDPNERRVEIEWLDR